MEYITPISYLLLAIMQLRVFCFVFNGRVITADSWLLNAIMHKYCIQSVFVSPLSDPLLSLLD